VGGTLNAKKLDINAGLGNDYLGVLLGQLVYPYNNAGTTTTYSVRDIAGIPDKMFGKSDNGGVVRHNFLYIPITGEDGRVWLNNDLGANYANVNNASFNPAQQATSRKDYNAKGSMFQWGRKPDGHELRTYSSVYKTGMFMETATVTTRSDNPSHPYRIINTTSDYSDSYPRWPVTVNENLWATEASPNNPCPVGYRVPRGNEWRSYIQSAAITNRDNAYTSRLRLCNLNDVDGQWWNNYSLDAWAGYYGNSWKAGYLSVYDTGCDIGDAPGAASMIRIITTFPLRCIQN